MNETSSFSLSKSYLEQSQPHVYLPFLSFLCNYCHHSKFLPTSHHQFLRGRRKSSWLAAWTSKAPTWCHCTFYCRHLDSLSPSSLSNLHRLDISTLGKVSMELLQLWGAFLTIHVRWCTRFHIQRKRPHIDKCSCFVYSYQDKKENCFHWNRACSSTRCF